MALCAVVVFISMIVFVELSMASTTRTLGCVLDVCERSMDMAVQLSVAELEGVAFMCAKDMGADMGFREVTLRDLYLNVMLDPDARARLLTGVVGARDTPVNVAGDAAAAAAVSGAALPKAWADASTTAVVFFRDIVPGSFVARHMASIGKRSCSFLLAPSVVVHYLMAHYYRSSSSKDVLDASLYMQHGMPRHQLWRYIQFGIGSSRSILQALTGVPMAHIRTLDPGFLHSEPGADATVLHLLTTFGPALVSFFSTHKSFMEADRTTYVGAQDQEPCLGQHAMVMVGWTREGGRYLLQNWWQDKQFVEVDLAYVASRGGHLVWVMQPVENNSPWPTLRAPVALSNTYGNDGRMFE